jgi:uncharacterized repeat protein (TIGR03847 family)
MSQIEFRPDTFTADYVGRPGRRTFFLQARSSAQTVSLLVEKQQVEALSEKLRELLMLVDAADTVARSSAQRDPALAIEAPDAPDWRVGTIGLAYEEDEDEIVVLVEPTEEEAPEQLVGEGFRFLLRRDQVRAFVLHSEAVVAEGRPLCQLCGLPMDPDGHACPASNGHRLTG